MGKEISSLPKDIYLFLYHLQQQQVKYPDDVSSSQSVISAATNHPANTPDSPESPRFLLRESPPDQPVAVEEAPVFEGAAG